MENVKDILESTSHRQYPLPKKGWQQYQERHDSIFMHWKVNASVLRALVPQGLEIDTLGDTAWITIVAFSVRNLQVPVIPPMPFYSDFHEVNVRTYVKRNGIPGIYFLSIEAQKLVPVLMARLLAGLPYVRSDITRNGSSIHSKNKERMLELDLKYHPKEQLNRKSELDIWLTERHALYQEEGGSLYRIDVHHKEWSLQSAKLKHKVVRYPIIGNSYYAGKPNLAHYASEVRVLIWARTKC